MNRSLFDITRSLLYAAWRRRYLIAVPFLLMLPISTIGSKLAPKSFEAKMLLLLQETSKDNPFLKDYSVGLNVKDRISALQALLKSEHVLANVLSDTAANGADDDSQARAMEIRELSGRISVQLIGSDLLELRLKGTNPHGMGKLLGAISTRFLDRLLSPERSSLGATQTFLKQQMQLRKEALDRAERAHSAYKIRNSDQLTAASSSNITRLSTVKQHLDEKVMELTSATAAFRDVRKQLAGTNPIVGRLEENIVQLSGELTSLRSRYTDDHSDVQSAERRLRRLQDERHSYIDASHQLDKIDVDRLWSIVAGQTGGTDKSPPLLVSQLMRLQDAQAKRVALEKDVEQLRLAVKELQGAMAENVPIEQQQAHLEKEVVSARDLYEAFAKRYDAAVTSHALGQFEAPERIKIIDQAQDPTIPATPPTAMFVLAGIVAGLALGIGLAVIAELLDLRLRDADEIRRLVDVPILARLPYPGDAAFARVWRATGSTA